MGLHWETSMTATVPKSSGCFRGETAGRSGGGRINSQIGRKGSERGVVILDQSANPPKGLLTQGWTKPSYNVLPRVASPVTNYFHDDKRANTIHCLPFRSGFPQTAAA